MSRFMSAHFRAEQSSASFPSRHNKLTCKCQFSQQPRSVWAYTIEHADLGTNCYYSVNEIDSVILISGARRESHAKSVTKFN